jgi:prefoldin subunit 2
MGDKQQREQEIVEGYKRLLDEREAIAAMILERQGDFEEHALVLKNLKGSRQDKKAWRLVGDVLVERTVESITPEIERNRDNLKGVIENAKQQMEAKSKQIKEYEVKFGIKIKGRDDLPSKKEDAKAQQGVLVN